MAQAKEKAAHTESMIAGEAMASHAYHGVKLSDDRTVELVDAITDVAFGVTQSNPASGEEVLVTVLGRTPLIAEETLVAGDHFSFNANAHAIKHEVGDTTAWRAGIITLGGASGETGCAVGAGAA